MTAYLVKTDKGYFVRDRGFSCAPHEFRREITTWARKSHNAVYISHGHYETSETAQYLADHYNNLTEGNAA